MPTNKVEENVKGKSDWSKDKEKARQGQNIRPKYNVKEQDKINDREQGQRACAKKKTKEYSQVKKGNGHVRGQCQRARTKTKDKGKGQRKRKKLKGKNPKHINYYNHSTCINDSLGYILAMFCYLFIYFQ